MIAAPRATRLAVGVPRVISRHDPHSGAGRMWHRVLDGLRGIGVRVEYVELSRRRLIRRRPDVWLVDGHMGALDLRGPVVAQLQEAPWAEPQADHLLDPAFLDACRRLSDAAAQQAAWVLTPSEFARRQVVSAHGVSPDRVRAVPHGVDASVFQPSLAPVGVDLVRAAGGRAPYVVFVSSVHPRKNLPALRHAMTLLADRGFEHGLVMVAAAAADRPDSTDLQRAAAAELPGHPGRVLTLKNLPDRDLAAVIAGASVLCAPSLSEGFGFAPLEAMACATPVVVANRGSLPEVVGPAGIVVEPEPAAVAAGLESVLSDPGRAAALGQAGLERSRGFTWRATAEGWLSVLEEAAST